MKAYLLEIKFTIISNICLYVSKKNLAIKRKKKEKNVQALKKRFFGTVRDFYDQALTYAKNKMPLSQSILKKAEVTDTTLRNTVEFTQIEYFMDRFPKIIPEGANKQDIQQEFATYKALPDERIPPHILRNTLHKAGEQIYEERGD